eukprot:745598-Hanusia_phi.AAC.2
MSEKRLPKDETVGWDGTEAFVRIGRSRREEEVGKRGRTWAPKGRSNPSKRYFIYHDHSPFRSDIQHRLVLTLSQMFYAAMYALKGRDERRNAAALSQLSDFDLGGRASGQSLQAHTQLLINRRANAMVPKVPAVSDVSKCCGIGKICLTPACLALCQCGLFGTDCDGNTYLQVLTL